MEMADDEVGDYKQFVIVAETEWKFDHGESEMDSANPRITKGKTIASAIHSVFKKKKSATNPRIVRQSLKMGTIEWNIVFKDRARLPFEFRCQTVAEGLVDEVHLELIHHFRSDSSGKGYKMIEGTRCIFTRSENDLFCKFAARANLFTIRILKKRSMFPDFTLESTVVGGRWASDGKLRVGDQLFYVNKQLLAMHSEFFDLMYNGAYKEANQEVVELKHEPADSAQFHDFLLVMCVPEALPNPDNVAALSHLANIYRVNSVRDKCQLHLWMCREMPVEQRYVLALQNGNKELQSSIRRNVVNSKEYDRIIAAVSEKAIAL